ncbi:primosomal protein N' [Nonomuraea sp. KC401]|uniref:primosomal protein N' n=1 Tax=Nonomuraea sp. K271 TaxID=1848319 RepID=UPI0010FECE66|nr:primosomal protein N' [Nonomuraea sp. K271]TLF72059.1 primosomal protein N' [Nonomuraea sp. KC401]
MTHSDDALLPLDAVRPPASSKDAKGAPVPAPERPVARIVVDSPLPHLDRSFDYLIPASMHETAEPGVRVRVRFAGKLVDGFLLERVEESEHEGRLTPVERVVSPERVLTPEIAGLARAVADRYAGTLTDVLRLAVPPRHAKVESETPKVPAPSGPPALAARAATDGGPDDPASPGNPGEGGPPQPGDVPAAGRPRSGEREGAAKELTTGEASPVEENRPPERAASDVRAGQAAPHGSGERAASPPGAGEDTRKHVEQAVPAGDAAATPADGAGPVVPAEGAKESAWDDYPTGPSFLDALRCGRAPRAVWSALPGARGWARAVAEAVHATLDGGRGAVLVVPDGKDVALVDTEFERVLGPGRHVALTAGLGPAERYRRWLKVLRGQVRAVVGTRAAMFAPVADLGLVAIWDDGDDLHAERLAPYPHAREVLGLRAHRTGAAMLIGGYARTAEATQLIASRWARPIVAARTTIRSLAPRVRPAGEDAELAKDQAARQARLPSIAWRALRQGLEKGPVLVQVPRRGYLPALACRHCRTPARCVLPPTRTAAPALPSPSAKPSGPAVMVGAIQLGGPDPLTGPSPAGPPGGADPGYGSSPAGRTGAEGAVSGPSAPGKGAASDGRSEAGRQGADDRRAHAARRERAPDRADRTATGPAGGTGTGRGEGSGAGGTGAGVSERTDPGPVGEGGRLCHGPLALRGGHAAPYCRWCGRVDARWRCPSCGSPRLRAVVTGARRTAEELGRAFPSVPVRTSGRDGVLATVPATRALVVATPGAEPVAEGGYAAAVLLDGWALLGRADLRASEEAVRRWMNAAALLRPGAELVVLGDAALPAVQALVRWDPVTHAERELGERAELGFPPAVRMATLTGAASAVRQMLDEVRLPPGAQVLGPVPVDEQGQERAMIRVRRQGGAALAAALKGASGVRAARKTPEVVRVSVDPLDLI